MRINVCVPTRSKNAYLAEYPVETARNAVLPTTRIVLGFDQDDPMLPPPTSSYASTNPRIMTSIEPREDSLGAKYNRCARAYPADLYVLSMDDVAIATKGWDEVLAKHAGIFKDGIGYLYFGKEPGGEPWPAMIAVTKGVVERIGFCPEHYPFWFNNICIHEVATMVGRIIAPPIDVRYPERLPESPRRDVAFWAEFHALTRPLRIEQAAKLMEAMDDGPTTRAMLRATLRGRLREFATMDALRDRKFAAQMVKIADPMDARHARLKTNARALIETLKTKVA